MWSCPRETATLLCDDVVAGDVRKQTESSVNVQCPYGTGLRKKRSRTRSLGLHL
jgi:hypothetical protein